MKPKTVDEYLYDKVVKAFLDVLDSNQAWYDIQYNTGLPEDRCKEIEQLFNALVEVYYK